MGVPSPATYFHTSSRPLGLNYDPTLRPAFPSFALLPRGLCPWPESGGRGGTVMPWASGACHSHHPRLCLSPTVQVRQAEAEASREGGSAPSQGGPQVVVLRLAHPSLPTTAHLLGPFSVQCSLSLPPPPVVPSPRPVPPLDQSNRDPLANTENGTPGYGSGG